MSYPTTLCGWSELAEAIDDEIRNARCKFPKPDHLVLALAEESGEAVKAALNLHYIKDKESDVAFQLERDLRKELIQTAAMCIRLAKEGDPTIGVRPVA